MADLKEIGKRIQNRRKQQGYTQEQIADMMDVSIQMISNLERGNKAIRIDNLVNLCRILDVSTDYVLTGKYGFTDTSELTQQISRLSQKDQKMIALLVEFCLTNND